MLYWILAIVIFACLALIGYIVFSKFPKISLVDTEKAPALKQAEVKRRILEERFSRHIKTGAQKAVLGLAPLFGKLAGLVKNWYRRLLELEEWYRHKALKSSFKDKVGMESYTGQLLAKADEETEEENFEDAERKYLEVLKLDDKSVEAYKGLGNLYFQKKDFEHAREIYEFLLKLNHEDPAVFRHLGEIASEKGDLKSAEEKYYRSLELDEADLSTIFDLANVYLNLDAPERAFALAKKAVSLEPNNPKALDFMLAMSIITRDKDAALMAWRALREANPQNQKLAEYKQQIEKL